MFKSVLISNLAFVVKALSLLGMSVILVESVSTKEFALWSLLVSVSLFFTLSDLGVGQYLLRQLVAYRKDTKLEGELIKSVAASNILLMVVVLLFIVVGFFGLRYMPRLGDVNGYELGLFVALVSVRSLLIPYFAQLSANEWFYIRKNIEAFSSLLALLVVWWLIGLNTSVVEMIIVYQLVITVSGVLAPIFCHYKGAPSLVVFRAGSERINSVFSESFPYFINNLSLLITRGGFVFLVGFLVGDAELAEIAVYYAVFFQVFYQVFDMVIRIIQPKILLEPELYKKARLFFVMSMGVFVLGVFFFGETFVNLLYPNIHTHFYTMLAFAILSISEIFFSLFNAQWQMYSKYNHLVMISSVTKAVGYVCLVGVFYIFSLKVILSYLLLLFCVLNLLSLVVAFCSKARVVM